MTTAVAESDQIDPKNPPDGRFLDEWSTVHMAGGKIGYSHLAITRTGDLIHTMIEMKMRFGRVDQPVGISTLQTTTETLEGVPVSFTATLDASIMKTSTKGTIKDGKVTLVQSQYGMDQTNIHDFPTGALMTWGMFRESLLRGFKPGTKYVSQIYAPDLRQDGAVTATTTIGDWESLDLNGRSVQGQRITLIMESPIGSLEMLTWLDKKTKTLKAQLPMPGMGNLDIITSDQATALADFVPPELFMSTAIDANRKIDGKAARRIKYRVAAKSPDTDLGTLPNTGMQTARVADDGSIEVVITRRPVKPSKNQAAKHSAGKDSEYLGRNLMMNTADPQLIELAKRAAGSETEPFALADILRRFVTDYVTTKSLNIGFGTASEVCRSKEGDCSEHAVLLAALGRLNGIPSRVAVGVVYVPRLGSRSDVFGYHMWTQFLIDGEWIDLDAALRETDCSPTRIAFATSSLKDAGLADLSLPLLSRIGGITIEVLEVE
jgi:hypothetical protein